MDRLEKQIHREAELQRRLAKWGKVKPHWFIRLIGAIWFGLTFWIDDEISIIAERN